MTGEMDPESLRKVKNTYDTIQEIRQKAVALYKTISAAGSMDPILSRRIATVRSLHEIETIVSFL